MSDTRIDAINRQYQQRETNLAAARGLDAPDFDAVETENFGDEVEGGTVTEPLPLPTESWKRGEIVRWLVDNEVIESEDVVDGLTKAEMIGHFVDTEA
jgi:hypothetical protein